MAVGRWGCRRGVGRGWEDVGWWLVGVVWGGGVRGWVLSVGEGEEVGGVSRGGGAGGVAGAWGAMFRGGWWLGGVSKVGMVVVGVCSVYEVWYLCSVAAVVAGLGGYSFGRYVWFFC